MEVKEITRRVRQGKDPRELRYGQSRRDVQVGQSDAIEVTITDQTGKQLTQTSTLIVTKDTLSITNKGEEGNEVYAAEATFSPTRIVRPRRLAGLPHYQLRLALPSQPTSVHPLARRLASCKAGNPVQR